MHDVFKCSAITGFDTITKPQLLPPKGVKIVCNLVSYWFKRDLEFFTANQSSFYLNARLRRDKETNVIALKKTIANPSYHIEWMFNITLIIFLQHILAALSNNQKLPFIEIQ